jgi:hypothetical protein
LYAKSYANFEFVQILHLFLQTFLLVAFWRKSKKQFFANIYQSQFESHQALKNEGPIAELHN